MVVWLDGGVNVVISPVSHPPFFFRFYNAVKQSFCFAALVKARVAAQAAKKGNNKKAASKIRTSVHFRRPKTLSTLRNPKYQRKSVHHQPRMNKFSVIKYPMCTESAMKQIEDNNTLTFIVDLKATKRNIRNAVAELYELKNLMSINTLIR
jgi:large subunit ribosomal protein L23Ae